MVNTTLSTRRSFLYNLSLLTAGAAVIPLADLLGTGNITTHVEQQWKTFCSLNGGKLYRRAILPADQVPLLPSAGHVHKTGQAICFPDDYLLALPTWVYWGTDPRPADVIVSFFCNKAARKKLCRINRFELEALNLLCQQPVAQTALLMSGPAVLRRCIENGETKLYIRTRVSKNNMQLSVLDQQTKTNIEKTILHYT